MTKPLSKRTLALLVALALARPALAAPAPPPPKAPPADVATTASEQARVHFDRGTRAYNLGEFPTALAEYRAAYELHPLPAFLFNIGQCHFALGDYEKAVFFYEGFLRESPTSEHRQRVESFIDEARRLDAQHATTTAAPPTAPSSPPTATATPTPAPTATKTSAAPPVAATVADSGDESGDESVLDAAWFWPAVIGAGVVVVATGAGVSAVLLSAPPSTTLDVIDARETP